MHDAEMIRNGRKHIVEQQQTLNQTQCNIQSVQLRHCVGECIIK